MSSRIRPRILRPVDLVVIEQAFKETWDQPQARGFRLGVYVFKDAEIVDYAAPYGVFSVARRFDPELDLFFIADAKRPVQTQAGFTVLPNYSFLDRPSMDAFLVPGGYGTRQEPTDLRTLGLLNGLLSS